MGLGASPPTAGASVGDQASASASASFEPAPTGATLCGFGIPAFKFNLSFKIPKFPPFPFPPNFAFFLQLKCDLSNPIDAGVSFGGGRVGTTGVDVDDEFKQAA